MLACFVDQYPLLVIKLFNTILESNKSIPDWSIGMITPIFKKGSMYDPSNYRGISLLSCFGKLIMTLHNMEPGFIWNERHKETFNFNLTSDIIKRKFQYLLTLDELQPAQVANDIKTPFYLLLKNVN